MTPQTKNMLIGFVVGAAVAFLLFMLIFKGAVENIDIEVSPGKTVRVKLDGKKINDTVLLNSLWNKEYTKYGMLGWLKTKAVYQLTDPTLKSDTVLLSMIWNDIYSRKGMINWLNSKGIYDINEQDKLIIAIRNQLDNQKLIDEVKEMDKEAKLAQIDVPDYNVPPDTAYIWAGSKLDNKRITFVSYPEGKSRATVYCVALRGRKLKGQPDLAFHLNVETCKKLLGEGFLSGKCYLSAE